MPLLCSSSARFHALVFAAVVEAFLLSTVGASGGSDFLGGPRSDHLARDSEFSAAMGSVMGCGDPMDSGNLWKIETAVQPIWKSLPKNQYGRIEWPLMRYMMHRYFMSQSSLLVRGFEPQANVNDTHWATAAILKQHASILNTAHEGKRSASGFSLDDLVSMVATLEKLMRDEEISLLSHVYLQQRRKKTAMLNHQQFEALMVSYMAHWLMSDDLTAVDMLLHNETLMYHSFPKWDDVKMFARGVAKTLEFEREQAPQPGHARVAMNHLYSFEDARDAVEKARKEFASFWETECQNIKSSLVEMDRAGKGRVRLGEFYNANVDGEWRFGESESYLKALGALDDSSSLFGKQVIIPNYMQAASNCIATTKHYLVCCVNECESVMNDIEKEVGAPVALPEKILPLVGNMTNWEDDAPRIDGALEKQLMHIAEVNNGKVPLHGRLFAQWLHYVFPRECPYPHGRGMSSAMSPSEFGDGYIASDHEIEMHATEAQAGKDQESVSNQNETEMQQAWMSQWTEEEELIADYSAHANPWKFVQERLVLAAGIAMMLVILWVVTNGGADGKPAGALSVLNPAMQKRHFV